MLIFGESLLMYYIANFLISNNFEMGIFISAVVFVHAEQMDCCSICRIVSNID
jgi:hypothetical protein